MVQRVARCRRDLPVGADLARRDREHDATEGQIAKLIRICAVAKNSALNLRRQNRRDFLRRQGSNHARSGHNLIEMTMSENRYFAPMPSEKIGSCGYRIVKYIIARCK